MPDLNDLLNRPFADPDPKPKRSRYDTAYAYLKTMSKDELKSLKKEINKLLRQQFFGNLDKFINKRNVIIALIIGILTFLKDIISFIIELF